VKILSDNSVTKDGQAHTYYNCPCCYYPTLTERGGFDICKLCFWEDDGQDDQDADKVRGGLNSNYSLTEARENFKQYYTMYRPKDESAFERSRIKKGVGGKILLD
jgi:hypothetical protein